MARRSKAEFIQFLEGRLIPDLKESGSVETAKDFEEAILYMRRDDRNNRAFRALNVILKSNPDHAQGCPANLFAASAPERKHFCKCFLKTARRATEIAA